MEKLKLCHVSLALFPDHKDGSAKTARGLYDALKARGHDITFLTAKWGEGFHDPNIIALDVPNSRFSWVPKFILSHRKYLKTHDFDIIHGNGSRGSLPIMYSGKPFITTIHDLGPFEADFVKIPILKWIEKKNARMAKRIITPSEMTKQGVIKYMGADPEKITPVYWGYDDCFKPMPKESTKLKEKLGITGPVIYYVGRLAFYKGVDHIIEAYKKAKKEIPDLNLIIGGKATLKMENTVSQWIHDNPDVKFVGMVKEEEMATYYSMADLFVTYSFASEGFGITPIEAIASGTPVMCSTLPAYQEIFQDNAIFVEPKRPDLLAEAMIKFFKKPEIGRDLMDKATKFIERYTWDSVTDRVEQVYASYLQEFGK